MTSREQHDRMANAIRFLSMDAVEKANSGHPGLPMGCADIATVLFTRFLKFDAKAPHWADRDRFILSALVSASSRVLRSVSTSLSIPMTRLESSESSSITMMPAITVSRWSPISPKESFKWAT